MNKVHPVISDEVLARNIVRAMAHKGAWGKVEEIARGVGSGLTATEAAVHAAHEAVALRDEKVARRAAPRRPRRHYPGPVVLSGPAAAGKRGGGKEAPPLPPTPSKKTNVGYWSGTGRIVPKDDKNK